MLSLALPRFNPWSGNKDPEAWVVQKKKQNKTKKTPLFWFKVEQRQAPFPLDPYTVSQILEKKVFTPPLVRPIS